MRDTKFSIIRNVLKNAGEYHKCPGVEEALEALDSLETKTNALEKIVARQIEMATGPSRQSPGEAHTPHDYGTNISQAGPLVPTPVKS